MLYDKESKLFLPFVLFYELLYMYTLLCESLCGRRSLLHETTSQNTHPPTYHRSYRCDYAFHERHNKEEESVPHSSEKPFQSQQLTSFRPHWERNTQSYSFRWGGKGFHSHEYKELQWLLLRKSLNAVSKSIYTCGGLFSYWATYVLCTSIQSLNWILFCNFIEF